METLVQNVWSKSKLLVKGLLIGLLALILQIPAFYVKDLIAERETRQREAVAEVSSKWAAAQTITGPVLVLPYWDTKTEAGTLKIVRAKQYAYFLPDDLSVRADVTPQERHRGIYKVMLYASKISIKGRFQKPAIEKLNILPEDIIWSEAAVKLPVTDNMGLDEEVILNWNDSALVLSPQTFDDRAFTNALQASLTVSSLQDLQSISFSSSFNLNGSQQLLISPTGKTTAATINSAWPHPSFKGSMLPQKSEIGSSGFSAAWKSSSHKRNFPQQWAGTSYFFGPSEFSANEDVVTNTRDVQANNINASAFGASLFMPVNSYQKTMRSVKYAALFILLTFAAFFLIEVNNKKSVHPFQYGLIGLALILFYTLLLSFSEYIGFNLSYVIASICTIGLIGWFVKGLLASSRLASVLSVILGLLYVYVFTILQLQDYSLLLGSLGLFITLAVIMHFSKKIQW
jgi:inner membrane protein